MVGMQALAPNFEDNVPIYIYRPGVWKRELISEDARGVLHSIYPFDWDGHGAASAAHGQFRGIRVLRPAPGGAWSAEESPGGILSPCPKCGSSEMVVGPPGKTPDAGGHQPWHGNQVVVYQRAERVAGPGTRRHAFQGHALAVGDLNGDGRDKSWPGSAARVTSSICTRRWTKADEVETRDLDDGGIAAADCKIADFVG